MKHLLIVLLGMLPVWLAGQSADTLSTDLPYFRAQSDEYQRWLGQAGLDHVLRVQSVEVRADTQFILYLGFSSTDADTVTAQWEQLRTDYLAAEAGDSLEKALFDRMTYLMSVPPTQAEIRLFDTYQLDQKACFGRQILLREGRLRVNEKSCKSEYRKIVFQPKKITVHGRATKAASFGLPDGKDSIFQRLIPFLTNKYTRTRCDNRRPYIKFYNVREEIHFEVRDLCKEVLTDEENPWWCEVLYGIGALGESEKNCIKRERLVGHITYEALPDSPGFTLRIKIDAAYGSGWYNNPRDNGYHDIQAEYPAYLRVYADRLKDEIQQFLTKP